MSTTTAETTIAPLHGSKLFVSAFLLAVANFVVVLDTTIANVSVPNIAGGLAISPNQGTYVITSYAVAEAITVPLTGWLATRFGALRVFVFSMLMFGVFSFLCGISHSLEMLVFSRIMQGFAGGPLMPLSQTLMMRIFPKEKMPAAMGLWAMTTLIAPVMGPILGGVLCDNLGWPFIFYINIPIALICSFFCLRLLKNRETPTKKVPVDYVGLGLLLTWVASLQIMLDKGKELDWFQSGFIIALAVIALISFASFLIWELTAENPIVNLSIFRYRGYFVSVFTICVAFGAFFSAAVLTPLWLQTQMGYTATWSGKTTGMMGVLAVVVAPFAAQLSAKVDSRRLVFFGVMWLAFMTFLRAFDTTDVTYTHVAFMLLALGAGLPFFFIPLTNLALSSVSEEETASAAGLMNFARTLSGAFATSIVTTLWENKANYYHAELSGQVDRYGEALSTLTRSGVSHEQALAQLDNMLQNQSFMISTNHIFMGSAFIFAIAAIAVWFAPKPTHNADTTGVH
jgi:MFS transporter, DHA2 family, multidrug resistance protein